MPDSAKDADWREYQVLLEVDGSEQLTQRNLVERLGVGLGTINHTIKRMMKKGYVKTKQLNGRSITYSLTAEGFSRKMRYIVEYARKSFDFFSSLKESLGIKFRDVVESGRDMRVIILGTGEVAEVVYLSIRDNEMDLEGVYADSAQGKWLGHVVKPVSQLCYRENYLLVVTDLGGVLYSDNEEIKKFKDSGDILFVRDMLTEASLAFGKRF